MVPLAEPSHMLARSPSESQLGWPVVNILLWKQNQEQQAPTGFHGNRYLCTLKNDCSFLGGKFNEAMNCWGEVSHLCEYKQKPVI